MTAGALLLTVAGLLVAAGVVGIAASATGVRLLPTRTSGGSSARFRFRLTRRHGIATAVGVIVLLLTGWPVAALATAAAVIGVPGVLGGGKQAKVLIARSEALADWTRRLADLISSGAAGSTRDALIRSAGSVAAPIEGPVRALVARIGPRGIEPALRHFAAEVADPAADKVAGVLILRERNGGPGLADVLTGLAADLDERARMVRDIEAERAKPRANMRTIVTVTGILIAAMMLFAREFLSSYSSITGQVLLAVVAGVFAIALRWMHRLADPPQPNTVLSDPTPTVSVLS